MSPGGRAARAAFRWRHGGRSPWSARQVHCALPVTARGALSLAHCSLHVESVLHDSEHEPWQRTVQVEPPVQPTLPLGPTVRSHSEAPPQVALQEGPQAPVHWLLLAQLSVQLEAAQPELPRSHEVSAGQVHEVPTHLGGGGPSSPQPASTRARARARSEGSAWPQRSEKRGASSPCFFCTMIDRASMKAK